MTVVIYTKKDCKLCADAKQKLDLMGVQYTVQPIEPITTPHEGWRDDGTIDAQAMFVLNSEMVPMIVIDGKPYPYSTAMAELKKRSRNDTAA
jgi:glutaredoxin